MLMLVKIQPEAMRLVADCHYLTRIMYNLVNNAIQAMPSGGKLTVQAYNEGNFAIITVNDTGVGIPDNVKGKLFTPMFTTKSKGKGLD
jgi:signal transduction histidine kinase